MCIIFSFTLVYFNRFTTIRFEYAKIQYENNHIVIGGARVRTGEIHETNTVNIIKIPI